MAECVCVATLNNKLPSCATEQDHFGQRISLLFAHQCAVCVSVFVVDHITKAAVVRQTKLCSNNFKCGYVTFRHSSTRESSKVCIFWFCTEHRVQVFPIQGLSHLRFGRKKPIMDWVLDCFFEETFKRLNRCGLKTRQARKDVIDHLNAVISGGCDGGYSVR